MNSEENKQNNKTGSIKNGIGLVLGGHIIYCCLCFISIFFENDPNDFSYIPLIFLILIGLVQFIYVIPMVGYFSKETKTLKGILITSGITFSLTLIYLGYSFSTFSSDPPCPKYYCKNKVIYEKNKNPSKILDFNKSNKIETNCCEKLAKISTENCIGVSTVVPFKDKDKLSIISTDNKQKKLLSCKVQTDADPVLEMEKIGISFNGKSTVITKANGVQEVYIDVLPEKDVQYYRCSPSQPLQKEKCK